MIALVVEDDGRPQYLYPVMKALEVTLSLADLLPILINDSGNPEYARRLIRDFPDWEQVHHDKREGLRGVQISAWHTALMHKDVDYVLHWESDFMPLEEKVPVDEMRFLLEARPHLAQVALKRQPLARYPGEVENGGFMQLYRDQYFQRPGYVEQQMVFTMNPCLVPRRIVEMFVNDPTEGNPESYFTPHLVDEGYWFAFLGRIEDPPRVFHIGIDRGPGWFI